MAVTYNDPHRLCEGRVLVYRRGDGDSPFWYARLHVDGRYKTISLKTKSLDIAKERAQREYWKRKIRFDEGLPIDEHSFKHVAELWITEQEQRLARGEVKKHWPRHVRSVLTNGWIAYLKGRTISSIQQKDIDGYPAWRQRDKKLKAITINNDLTIMSVMMKWAIRQGYVSAASSFEYKRLKGERGHKGEANRRPAFTETDLNRVRAFIIDTDWANHKNGQVARRRSLIVDYMNVLAWTGIRVSEARTLTWGRITWFNASERDPTVSGWQNPQKRGDLRVELKVDGKTGIRETIASEQAARLLIRMKNEAEWNEPDDLVFCHQRRVPLERLIVGFQSLLKAAGVTHDEHGRRFTIYSLRHYYITSQLMRGKVDVYTIAKNAGTSLEQIRNFYDQASLRHYAADL